MKMLHHGWQSRIFVPTYLRKFLNNLTIVAHLDH